MNDAWPDEWRASHPLRKARGLYAIDYRDRVKFGIALDLRARLLTHYSAGGRDARCWVLGVDPIRARYRSRSEPYRLMRKAETRACTLAERRGGIRTHRASESFTGVSFAEAIATAQDALWDTGLPLDQRHPSREELEASLVIRPWETIPYRQTELARARGVDIPLARLTEEPKP